MSEALATTHRHSFHVPSAFGSDSSTVSPQETLLSQKFALVRTPFNVTSVTKMQNRTKNVEY